MFFKLTSSAEDKVVCKCPYHGPSTIWSRVLNPETTARSNPQKWIYCPRTREMMNNKPQHGGTKPIVSAHSHPSSPDSLPSRTGNRVKARQGSISGSRSYKTTGRHARHDFRVDIACSLPPDFLERPPPYSLRRTNEAEIRRIRTPDSQGYAVAGVGTTDHSLTTSLVVGKVLDSSLRQMECERFHQLGGQGSET